jgi:tetratricopeptide (TPR) repeat protein
LWLHKRGIAKAALGKTAEAEADLTKAIKTEGRKWVHGRSHLELGKLALKRGNRAAAQQEFQQAIALCEADNDPAPAAEARRLMK